MKLQKLTQLLLVLFLTALLALQFFASYEKRLAEERAFNQLFSLIPNPFNAVVLEAQTALVMDLDTHTPIYVKHPNQPRPIASITKLMTADIALRTIDPEETVDITPEALKEEGEYGLKSGQKWKAKDLIAFMLIESSNDAAHALQMHSDAKQAITENALTPGRFIDLMNARGQELNLPTALFGNPSGLDTKEKTPTAFASAKDTVYLLDDTYTNYPDIIGTTKYAKYPLLTQEGKEYIAENTNDIAELIPGLLASKTGFTDSAGGNLVILYQTKQGKRIGVSVLGSSLKGRFTDIEALVNATNTYLDAIYASPLKEYYPW